MKTALILAAAVAIAVSRPSAQNVQAGDQWLTRPVDDRTFEGYLEFYAYDRAVPFDTRVSKIEDDQGLKRERLTFQSTPGVRVPAILWRQEGASADKQPAIILLHGGSPRGKEGTAQNATLLARVGWAVLAIDLPYFGERTTDLFTTFSEQEKHEKLYNQPSAYLAWMTQTVKDVRRSYDWLVSERGVDGKRVAIMGSSRGAIVASIAGSIERRFAAVALVFGGHFDALETGHLPAACPANYVGRIAPRPLLMINGTEDSDMIRDRSVEPLFKLARQPKQIIWTAGGHGFMTEEHRAALIQWLREKTR